MTVYLIVRGEVETAPGRFEPGVVSSGSHATREDALAQWRKYVDLGIWEEPFESYEIREDAPALSEVLPGAVAA